MGTVINLKLGTRNGTKRVWIEGQRLARMGYEVGMAYQSDVVGNGLMLRPSEEGAYKISRRNKSGKVLPVICIKREELNTIFAGVEYVTVTIDKAKIIIEPHFSEAREQDRAERLLSKLASGVPLDVASLYHGGGVLDSAIHSGLLRAGVSSRLCLAVEIEQAYLESSLKNNSQLWDKNSVAFHSPIQDINVRDLNMTAEIACIGQPCTGASKAGRAKNKLEYAESHQEAGALFYSTLRFIEALNAPIVILENVQEYANTASMVVIRSVLVGWGYDVQERVMYGNEFGALENRKRLCLVAICKRVHSQFRLDMVTPIRVKENRLLDILDKDVTLDSPRWKTFEYLATKENRDLANGKNFRRQLLTGHESFCGSVTRSYAKCRSTDPFLVHPENKNLSRLFTVTEHAKLKGVRKNIVEGVSDTVAHEILGQGIIYPMFEAVALGLGRCLSLSAGRLAA